MAPRTNRPASLSPVPLRSRVKRAPLPANNNNHRSQRTRHRSSSASAYARSASAVAHGIAQLKRMLLDGAPTHEIIDDFFDEVTSQPAFTFDLRRGPTWLCDAIARSCEEILDEPQGESTVFLVDVPEHDLVHGSIVIGEYVGTAVFFEDIQLGAMGLYPAESSGEAYFMRLVMVEDPHGARDAPN